MNADQNPEADLFEEGWPEKMHGLVTHSPVHSRITLLGLVALTTALGQEDPVTAALDIMRTHANETISPMALRALVEEFDAR